MSILAIRSIPLSQATTEAWRSIGVRFLSRARDPNEYISIAHRYEHIINLGNSRITEETDSLWNKPSTCRILRSPALTHATLRELCPPFIEEGDLWIKGPGRHDQNKIRTRAISAVYPRGLPPDFTAQQHIEGTEYRVNTVGPRVVQVHKMVRDQETPSQRIYTWVGLRHTPNPVKTCAREAAAFFPNNILAWDITLSPERAFILEGNTSPGLNPQTARRILQCLNSE